MSNTVEKKCLVVGCDTPVLQKMRELLSGVRVDHAETAIKGLEMLEEQGYGQLVLDSRVEGSLELLTQISKDPTFRSLKRTVCLESRDRVAPVLQYASEKSVNRVFYFPLDAREMAREVATNLQTRIPATPLFGGTRLDPAFEPLVAKFRRATRERVNRILKEYEEARAVPSHLRELEREAHRLRGSMGSFGYSQGSILAEQLETVLQSSTNADSEVRALGQSILAQIEDQEEALVPQSPMYPHLMVVTEECQLATGLVTNGAGYPVRIVLVPNSLEAREVAITNSLAGAIVDLREEYEQGLSLINFLYRNFVSRIVAILPPGANSKIQVEVANAGAWRVLEASLTSEQILESVAPSFAGSEGTGARILTVDDDPVFLATTQGFLQSRGFKVTGLSDPQQFWDELEAMVPELILLDVDMPEINGVELCRALRASSRWAHIPVLFLTSCNDSETRYRVFSAGGDDYIVKPFVGPELLQRIENRLASARTSRDQADLDPLTGLLTRRKALSLLRRFVDMAGRNSTAASMAVIDLDHFKSVNDTYGHPAGDQVLVRLAELLKGALRSNDVVARWGGEEFVVGVLGLAKASTAHRLRDILESLKRLEFAAPDGETFQVSFSAGVAHFPQDGQAVEDLYKAADEALYESKRQGRSRVTLASAHEKVELDRYDVAVVEDDAPLAEVIAEACRSRCLSSTTFSTAESFLNSLKSGGLDTRILILDFDLPDLDGLEILKKLREAKHHPKVLMLSGKMTEQEILTAHDLGLHEYLQKPIHLSVLMRRVERALNA